MRFTYERAEYVLAAIKAVDSRDGGAAYEEFNLTPYCDECGERPDALSSDDCHAVGVIPSLDYAAYVIVGCEGYWHIDPNRIGIDRPQWQASPRLTSAE